MTDNRLFEAALRSQLIRGIQSRLDGGEFLSLAAVATAAKPFVAALLARLTQRPLLVITDGQKSQEALFNDLQAFQPAALCFPAWENLPHQAGLPTADTIADRLRVVSAISNAREPVLIVASAPAIMQRTFSAAFLARQRLTLVVGATQERDALVAALTDRGYNPEVQVSDRGDLAVRGGIVDLFPLDRDNPVRIELFGDQIESIRAFDAASQQSIGKLDSVVIPPAEELRLLQADPSHLRPLLELLPANTLVLLDEPERLAEAAAVYAAQLPDGDAFHEPWDAIVATRHTQVYLSDRTDDADPRALQLGLDSLDAYRPLDSRTPEPEVAERLRREFFLQLRAWLAADYRLLIRCATAGERQRFEELWREQFAADPPPPVTEDAPLARGFLWPEAKLAVVTDAEIFGRHKLIRPRRRFHALSQPADWTEFEEGDYVVHLQHGIGKFLGLRVIESVVTVPAAQIHERDRDVTQRQEVLAIEYANQSRLYVPIDQAQLVTKYISAGKKTPPLHELGSGLWQRQKDRAERAILDLASELLEIQAARATLAGHRFSPDTAWQREFEAAFPYDETPDQDTAIAAVKADMESQKPMDRLICGDVGYGKTEVAIRAAFKAVMDGFQVAILVPTTVLAEQHFNTFRERVAGYPLRVEMLSRFRTAREQRAVVEAVAQGGTDIVIGTHRLLSADLRFKNLGLVVVDEEQRFGVLHKEQFKQLRKLIDVLTLSATPIPRTLYLSLTGARDMSTIQTPPQDRLPVETIVTAYDERLIRQAIQRELNRGGQVYFLHNRVQSIEAVAHRLGDLCAEWRPRIEVGHGQMPERQLEDVMQRFVSGQVDVLVCTTIIESGLDIPNANTIIIDRADRFGLGDLYQLRGRVGRYKHQAYAYLLLPRHLQLVDTARKRLSAIRQYSSLGSGFKIAMRDLEIRGAGNILGPEQSGHITAIGFDLYCQLLKESIGRLKGEKSRRPPAVTLKLDFLFPADGAAPLAQAPAGYLPEARLRVEAYRKIAQCAAAADVTAIRAELTDRYGAPPRAVELLLASAELRILAGAVGVTTLETRADKIMLTRCGELHQVNGKFPRLTKSRPEGKLAELRRLLEQLPVGA